MKWPLLSLLALGTVFAAPQPPCKNVEHCPLQVSPDDCDLDLFRRNCQVSGSHLEFLYWTTVTNNLIYAQKMDQPAWGPANNGAEGAYQTSSYNIDPGFRLTQSFFRAPRYWEVAGSYTRLTARGEDSASAPSSATQFLTGAWPLPLMSQLTAATSSLHLNYNVADFYVNRVFNPNPHLRIRMIAGLTGTWLTQNWIIRYSDILNNTGRVRNTWSYWGCGLRFGMVGDWFWTDDIYLTAKATFAGVMGPYHNRSFQTTTALAAGYNSTLPIRNASY
ncbi:MAG TPA: Lpg1974 family pore-forming outer membrane protein, partial [Chlamydiales bacterium]|nr:Lpg1974 family pore-forming outer membrane protein [Chlamydiales bacterium]